MYENNILKDIENISTIYIAGHLNPDGDAVGATFSLALAMAKLGKKPVVLLEKYDSKYNILSGREFVYEGDYSNITPDIMFAVDCASKDRLGNAESLFNRAGITYNIDHHISNTKYADNNIVNGQASSASEIVFEVISKFTDIDKEIATSVYTGILMDTGGFMHNCTSERTHQIAGRLVSYGVDTAFIHSKMLKERTLAQIKVLCNALKNLCVTDGIAYSMLTAKEIKDCGAVYSDLDGIVECILNINNVGVSLLATERDDCLVKLSFRSRTIDVNEVAALYGGGGHILASGAGVKNKPINEVVKDFVSELKIRMADYEK